MSERPVTIADMMREVEMETDPEIKRFLQICLAEKIAEMKAQGRAALRKAP